MVVRQFSLEKNNKMQLYVYPVENPNLLDSLRASVGLSSMADYLELLTKIQV